MAEFCVRNFAESISKIQKESVTVFFIVEVLLKVRDGTYKLCCT